MNTPLLVYMTTPHGPIRDAAWLFMLATHIRNATLATWDIPNTLASTIEDIARRLVTPEAESPIPRLVELLARYLGHHCTLSDQDGLGTLCECSICRDTRAAFERYLQEERAPR